MTLKDEGILSSLTPEQIAEVLADNDIGAEPVVKTDAVMPRRRKTRGTVQNGKCLSSVGPHTDDPCEADTHSGSVVSLGGETKAGITSASRVSLPPSIATLIELQKQRVFCIKSQSRCNRSSEAFIARFLGFRSDLAPDDRLKLFKQAAAIRRSVEKGAVTGIANQYDLAPDADGEDQRHVENQTSHVLSVCTPIILNSATARACWDVLRDNTEKEMRRLAKSLPVYPWVASIKGFGDLGLGIIVGEAGDLSNYETVSRLWKRLGLAVIEGERQQRKMGADAAAKHGYNPRRRAEIWTLGDSLFKHQYRGAKDDAPAHPTGPYGEVYAARKAATEGRDGWSLGRRDNDARRIMTKALLADLHKEWRKV